ncbi:apolipoprotein D-like [Lytechinus variegatus]|uniref:apolipoprotein D-like n=1 Tax=Lytechinus variegatus TaxID=7654 RepID=UPI001BB1FD40|nr:apolipoprotein D-like [Lytechinus variegatus]
MKQLALLLLLGFAGFSSAQVFGFGGCPEVRVAKDFQLDRYLGRWYEVTKFFAFFEAGYSCVTAEYRPGDDGQIVVINTGRTRDGEATRTVLGEILQPNPDEGAKLQVQFFNRAEQTPGDYWVLDVDYDSYALVHACSEIFFGWFNFQNNWVLARDPFPSEDVVQNALRKFGEQGINVEKFIRADQTNCETEPPSPTETPGTDRPRPSERPGTDRPRPSENPGTERPRPSEGTDRPRPSEGTDRPRPSENPGTERPRPSEGTDRPRPSEGTDRPRPTEPSASERPRP